ncbi:MAG: HEAT repeat domain-containing protein [Deltaproteobacteria bacterium]|nr:HEAT repeat domain-containing protein [Deltaproteobacteria bacterium]
MSHPLLVQLASGDPGDRAAACRAIAGDPAGALLAEPLIGALGDPERGVARAAGEALVALARRSEGVLPLLRAALRRGGAPRVPAALALARLEPPDPGLLPALVDGLGAREGDVRWSAARVLVDMGRLHPQLVGVLIGLVRSAEDPAARRMAAFALRELAPDHPETARALLAATGDDDPHVRRAAVTALAGLLDPPPEVGARLDALRADPDPTLARLATLAFERMQDRREAR